MVEIELYGYAGCSSCREAARMLAESGVSVTSRDLFADPLSADEIRSLTARLGKTPGEVLATRSRPYRELNLAERHLSDADMVVLMSDYPALLRRPIILGGGRHEIGFNRSGLSRLIASVKGEQNGHA